MYKVGLIGYGSIGKRHTRNLLSCSVNEIILLRTLGKGNEFGLKEYYSPDEFFQQNFDFIILSNPTSEHYQFLSRMISENRNIFCEKPVVCEAAHVNEIYKLLKSYSGKSITAYNLRFHPCVTKTFQLLQDDMIGEVLSARFFVGQYLPDWRPSTDYSQSYSAFRKMGGGVTLDLIHEIDLASFFCGEPQSKILSIADKFSSLQIETEDITEIIYKSNQGSLVSIHLDYVYRGYKREFELIGENGNMYCDLFNNTIKVLGEKNQILLNESFPEFERNDMYLNLMQYYLSCLKENKTPVPTIEDGLKSAGISVQILCDNKLV